MPIAFDHRLGLKGHNFRKFVPGNKVVSFSALTKSAANDPVGSAVDL
jgi:hypothetical protein